MKKTNTQTKNTKNVLSKKQFTKLIIGGICIITVISSIVACGSKGHKKTSSANKELTTEASTKKSTTKKTSQNQTTKPTTAIETTTAVQTVASTEPATEEQSTTPFIPEDQITEIVTEEPTTAQISETPAPYNTSNGSTSDPCQDHVNLIRRAYETNDLSALDDWDRNAFPKIKSCLDEAYQYSSIVDREKFVHDWICNNTVYDMENYINGTIPYISYTFNGVFENGVAVCDGYTSAFMLILNIMGIEAESQLGLVRGEGHSWVIVKLDDGEWYNVDVTFDDGDTITYDYFNVTTAELQAVRSFTPKRQCVGTQYSYANYFLQGNGHLIKSTDDFKTFITNLLNNDETESYVYISENVAAQCIPYYKYTYNTYASTGVGASVQFSGVTSPIFDGNEKYFKRQINIEHPRNFYAISSDEQLFNIVYNELLNGYSEIYYVAAPGYNIDQGINYLNSRSEEIWQHIATKNEYSYSYVIVLY